MMHIFRGHTDLIIGFNRFLPPGYHIQRGHDQWDGHKTFLINTPSGTSAHIDGPVSKASDLQLSEYYLIYLIFNSPDLGTVR